CLTLRPGSGAPLPTAVAEKLRTVPNPDPRPGMAPAASTAQAVNLVRGPTAGADASPSVSQITFDIGSSTLGGAAMSTLDQIAALARKQNVDITLAARDTENWDARKRDGLIDERVSAVVGALASRGIAPGAVAVVWRPDPADTSIHRGEPGLQVIARLRVAGGAEVPRIERPARNEQGK
ncbi:MAG: hypothetical protein JSR41_07820, partial [Proteobacteria bacterium]|nr:hypothetical protein [Pseudomonadota bacterium]